MSSAANFRHRYLFLLGRTADQRSKLGNASPTRQRGKFERSAVPEVVRAVDRSAGQSAHLTDYSGELDGSMDAALL